MLVEKQVRDFKMMLDTADVGMSTQLRDGMNWEGEAPDILDSILQPSWTVLEIGSCLGYYMCLTARKCAYVYAIEADPHNVEIMKTTRAVNGFGNVEIFNLAIAGADGPVKFARSPGRSDRGRMSPKGDIEVPGITLDTFVAEHEIDPDLIRCDIEGAEVHLVSAGEKTLESMAVGSWMFIDLHPLKMGANIDRLFNAIKKIQGFGFTPKHIFGPKVLTPASFADAICRSTGFPKVFLRKEG